MGDAGDSTVYWVERWEDAAPTLPLVAELTARGKSAPDSRRDAATLAVQRRCPVLRVMPHHDMDGCGYEGTHGAYSVAWAIPVLCQVPASALMLPTDVIQLRTDCAVCARAITDDVLAGGRPELPVGGPHLTWWDLTEPRTLRAEVAPAPERDERAGSSQTVLDAAAHFSADELRLMGGAEKAAAVLARRQRMNERSPRAGGDVYDWPALCDALAEFAATTPPPVLSPEQRVAVAGARRRLLLGELADAERSLQALMHNARAAGPVRLSVLSGVSRRTVPGWVTAGGEQTNNDSHDTSTSPVEA